MDHLVERMRRAPCDEIRIVTRPDKADVIANAERQGIEVVRARPQSLAESILTGARALPRDDVVLIGFPDSVWDPVDGYRSLLHLLDAGWQVALGLFRASDLRRYEPVLLGAGGRVETIEFKPERPSSDWLWGCAAAQAHVLEGLDGQSEPGIYFDALAAEGRVGGVRLTGIYVDIGTPSGLKEARAAR
jgi:hypothetical protein